MTVYEQRVKRLHDHVIANEKKVAAQSKPAEPTNAELKVMLDEKGIAYDAKVKKEDLIKLLEGAE